MKEKIDRINKIVSYLIGKGLISRQSPQKEIAEKIESNSTNVSYALNGNTRYLTDSFLKRTNKAFGNIFSESWLLTGEGNMLNEEDPERKEKEISISPSDIKEGEYSGALVYNIDGTCGVIERDMAFTKDNIVGSVNLPEINKESKIIRANGDSMEPVIFDGDRVVLRQIHNFDKIFYGQIYLKYEPDEDNYIILRSRDDAYDDIKLHKSKIKKLFIVENILSVKSQL